MDKFTLSGRCAENPMPDGRVFCPALDGLSAAQVDLAFVIPRLDHNRAIRECGTQGDWAAVLASDPFGSEAALFRQLRDLGYRGVTNFPSSILLDGSLRQSMSTIPASPEFEYQFLARAHRAGFETMAFFLSLEQARTAIRSGLNRLVLHPGILDVEATESSAMVLRSLQRVIDTVRSEKPQVSILAYTSEWHESLVPLSTLEVDGLIWLEGAP